MGVEVFVADEQSDHPVDAPRWDTLARNVLPLQRERLVTLAAGADQRVTEVRLTAKGRKAIAAALPLWQQIQDDVAQKLGRDRVGQLRDIAAALELSAPVPAAVRRR